MTLRALARLLKRDVKSVHRDVTPLKEPGLVEDHQNRISALHRSQVAVLHRVPGEVIHMRC
jgi:predicted transcriptional regulator